MILVAKKPTKKKGSYYEGKTAKVYDSLHPKDLVQQDITITGKLTKTDRQIDVFVEPSQYDNLIIECKDHKRAIDIDQFSPFIVMLDDVRAKRGAMVSNSPYAASVRNFAKARGIDLLHIVDTGDPKIRTSIKASALLRDSKIKSYQSSFSTTANFSEGIPYPDGLVIITPDFQGSPKEVLNHLWNDTEQLAIKTGEHKYVITNGHVLSVNGNRIPMDKITLNYWVEVECFKGLVDVQNTVGIYDVMNNTYHCRSMETAAIEPYVVENQWKKISEEEASKVKTTLGMVVKSVY